MARWRLTASHYLHLEEQATWEYNEVDRETGRPKKIKFNVPTLLDINDPMCWTERYAFGRDGKPSDGVINVSNGNSPEKGDYIFHGDPTPDMIPLDDEAKKISAKLNEKWNMPKDIEPGTFTQTLLEGLQRQVADAQSTMKPTAVEIPGMADFMKAMADIQAQNAALLSALVKQSVAAERR